MVKFKEMLEKGKQIVKRNSSEEELRKCTESEGVLIILGYSRQDDNIIVYSPNRKTCRFVKSAAVQVFMNDSSLYFGEDELLANAESVYVTLHKQKLYIFIENEGNLTVYIISGKYAVWIDIFNKGDDKECIMFEPENEQDVYLFDILYENHLSPMAGEYILNKLENRLKRKFANKSS